MKAANPSEVVRHPRTEELLAYADGELPEVFVSAVESHLAACAECRDLIEDYREPAAVAAAEPWPSAADKQAAWQRLQASLSPAAVPPIAVPLPMPAVAANANGSPAGAPVAEKPESKVIAFPTSAQRQAPLWRRTVPWAATVAFGVLFFGEHRRAEDLATRPRAVNTVSVSAEAERSGEKQSVQLGEGGAGILVAVGPLLPPLSIELLGAGGREKIEIENLRLGFAEVLLPTAFPSGSYRVRILDGAGVERDAFDLEVTAARP